MLASKPKRITNVYQLIFEEFVKAGYQACITCHIGDKVCIGSKSTVEKQYHQLTNLFPDHDYYVLELVITPKGADVVRQYKPE